jgi:phosphatidylinositol alpha-1,6-mannosyltransferase
MKILLVASNLQAFGGIQAYNRKLLSVLKELGEEVSVVELPRQNLLQKIFFVIRFASSAAFSRPDFIFVTNLNYSPLGLFAKKFLGLPYGITFYGIEARDIKKSLHRKAVTNATLIFKVFEETGRNVLKQFPEVKGRILMIPNSVDGERFGIKPRRGDLIQKFELENVKVILTIGRMSRLDGENKGYKRVIKAMPQILKHISNAKYLLAGGGDDAEDAQKLAEELGLRGKVIFAGQVPAEDMVDFYNLADVFALPSKNEGFPALVLLESLACGVPVLGGAQPDAKEAFHGKYGLIVDPDNIEEIAEGLIKILAGNAPSNLKDKNWLRDKVLEEYGPEAYKNAVKKALDALLK